MRRYVHYIIRQLAHSTLLTALTLTSIVWLTQALRLMDFIVNQGVGIDMFLTLTVLLMPSLLLMILPIAVFIAAIFVYQRLKGDSELVVMEAAGLSRWNLVKPALMLACAMTLLGYVIAFWIMPVAYGKFREMQRYLRDNYASVLLQEGVFSSPVDGLTVFVRAREGGGFKGILVHDNREEGLAVTMMAEEGRLATTPQGQRFFLTNGNRQEMRHGRLSLLNFDSYTLDMSLYGKESGQRQPDPRELFLPTLLETDGLEPEEVIKRRGELHQRILWPLYTFTLMLTGLAILLSGEFSRRGNFWRILIASAVVTGLAVAGLALRNLIATHIGYLLLGYGIMLAPIFFAVQTLRGAKKRRVVCAYP
jgi:lipopolysaccharide export system permease protein